MTYAATVRGVTVGREGKVVPAVLLPKPITVKRPRQRKHVVRPRWLIKGSHNKGGRRPSTAVGNFGAALKDLGSAAGLLGVINREMAKDKEMVEVIAQVLQPLVKLLPLLKQLKTTSSR